MVKKYIVDSVKYWADEYHIDGFRFDLVGLIDTETINECIAEVHKTHPNVIFYGEGWSMTTLVTKEGYTMTTQRSSAKTPEFAFFSDNIRDMLKGSVFTDSERGYVSGAKNKASALQECFLGMPGWCTTPTQSINYASCHDNLSLFDKLALSNSRDTLEDRIKMNNLAAAIYMTSQGIPFMQAGEEMLRSKPTGDGGFDHNSYASSDEVNNLKWDNLNDETYQDVFEYYKGLIAFRKAHPALRMTSAEDVKSNITVIKGLQNEVTAFQINGGVNGEERAGLFVIFNPAVDAQTVTLPEGSWDIYINGEDSGTEIIATAEGSVTVEPISAMVLVQEEAPVPETEPVAETTPAAEDLPESTGFNGGMIAILAAVIAALCAVFIALKNRKK